MGRHAVLAPIATVLTGWLRPKILHSHAPSLPSFTFVLFDKGEQFLETLALVHAVKPPALAPHFLRGDFPESLYFCKFLFVESPLDNEKPVDMPKSGVVIVDGGDKGDAVAKFCFDLLKCISR